MEITILKINLMLLHEGFFLQKEKTVVKDTQQLLKKHTFRLR